MERAPRLRIGAARAALRQLLEDPDRTELVFEITEALAGGQPRRLLRRLRREPGGARLLRERPVFDPSTCDVDALRRLPRGSFGREFADWMAENDFSPGLMDRESTATDPDLAYLGQRLTQVHDFWHVLAGYNRDPLGELGVLAFTWAQSGSRGIAFIVLGVLGRSIAESWRAERRPWSPLVPYVWRAYRAGRRARFLLPVQLEELLPLPLASVRELLGIRPLESAFSPEALPPVGVAA